jgi:hypothetical protein
MSVLLRAFVFQVKAVEEGNCSSRFNFVKVNRSCVAGKKLQKVIFDACSNKARKEREQEQLSIMKDSIYSSPCSQSLHFSKSRKVCSTNLKPI